MKKLALVLSVVAIVAVVSMNIASAADKPEKKMIIGEVIEFSTYAMQEEGDMVEATRARLEQGFPAGIIEDETGDAYVAVYKDPAPASHLERGNEHLIEYVGKKVVTNGLVYEKNGVKVIRMSLVSEY